MCSFLYFYYPYVCHLFVSVLQQPGGQAIGDLSITQALGMARDQVRNIMNMLSLDTYVHTLYFHPHGISGPNSSQYFVGISPDSY